MTADLSVLLDQLKERAEAASDPKVTRLSYGVNRRAAWMHFEKAATPQVVAALTEVAQAAKALHHDPAWEHPASWDRLDAALVRLERTLAGEET